MCVFGLCAGKPEYYDLAGMTPGSSEDMEVAQENE